MHAELSGIAANHTLMYAIYLPILSYIHLGQLCGLAFIRTFLNITFDRCPGAGCAQHQRGSNGLHPGSGDWPLPLAPLDPLAPA